MMSDVAAHVLRLDHEPIVAAVDRAAQLMPYNGDGWRTEGELLRRRVVIGLDPCSLCRGTRRCPDCGGPCEVCVVRR